MFSSSSTTNIFGIMLPPLLGHQFLFYILKKYNSKLKTFLFLLCLNIILRPKRQIKLKGRTFPDVISYFYVTTMFFNDFSCQSKTESCSCIFCSKKWIKNVAKYI